MACRGVILDLDGTLADTLQDIHDAVNVGLEKLGLPGQPIEAIQRFVGDGLPLLCRRALGEQHADKAEQLAAMVVERYRLHDLDNTHLYDGIPSLLDGLTAQRIPIAVLSNKPAAATRRMVETLCGHWEWIAVEGYRAEEFKKPDPRTALGIVALMRARPAEVYMVGDSLPDIETAKAAGMVSVAATWGFRTREELRAGGPDYMIDEPDDLLMLL
jgi:phosphoglycolate phosphatase